MADLGLSASADDFAHGVCVASCQVDIRMGFIRKVYAILSAQLLVTVIMGASFMMIGSVHDFVKSSPGLINLAVYASLFSLIALMFNRQRHPINLYLLSLFTLTESYVLGATICFYETSTVLQAFLLCTVITLGLTLYTFQTKYDWTIHFSLLYSMLWMMIGIGLVQLLVPFNSQFDLMVSTFGAALFCGFIVIDTQIIMKQLSTDEYILGAINLYLDILNLFLYILRMLNSRN